MKIGIASDDQVNITQHFGRTRGFVIAEVGGDKIISKGYRENTFSQHMKSGGHTQEHGHSHTAILDALVDCDIVLAGGMGRRIYDDLRSANIQSVITEEKTVDEAIAAFINGALVDNPEKGCEH